MGIRCADHVTPSHWMSVCWPHWICLCLRDVADSCVTSQQVDTVLTCNSHTHTHTRSLAFPTSCSTTWTLHYKKPVEFSRYCWTTEGSGIEPCGVKNFLRFTSSRPALVSTQPTIQWLLGLFPGGGGGEENTHHKIVPRKSKTPKATKTKKRLN
jgi:hypothetical protein